MELYAFLQSNFTKSYSAKCYKTSLFARRMPFWAVANWCSSSSITLFMFLSNSFPKTVKIVSKMHIGLYYFLPSSSHFFGMYTCRNFTSPLIRETIYGSSISYLKSAVNISVNIGQLAKNFSAIGPTPDAPAATPQLIPSIASITSASVGALNSGFPRGI